MSTTEPSPLDALAGADFGDARLYRTIDGPMLGLRGDRFVSRALEVYGEFSRLEFALFEQIVRPGAVVVEVGANIGAHTVALARRCAPGPLYAFEPQQRVFQLLCANLALNGIGNVVALPEAVGAAAGFAAIPRIAYDVEANFGGVELLKGGDAAPSDRVRMIALDDLHLPACNLLKIDAEGYEAEILRGAEALIRRTRPILYVENDRRERQQEVISLIDRLGYRQYWHTPPLFNPQNANGVAQDIFPNLASINLLCLPAESAGNVAGQTAIDPDNWEPPIGFR